MKKTNNYEGLENNIDNHSTDSANSPIGVIVPINNMVPTSSNIAIMAMNG